MSVNSLKSTFRAPVGRQVPTPARLGRRFKAPVLPSPSPAAALALPHERDESRAAAAAAVEPDVVMVQAKRDLDAGQVDTDMRATPGLDATLRAELVPGPGGKPLAPEG
jgi:hypothetical protein